MTDPTSANLGVCSWSLQSPSPGELADAIHAVGLTKVQLALNPLRDQPHTWSKAQSVLASQQITIVSGMFSTIGEDYSTPKSIRLTGGVVPDHTWPENWQIVQDVATIATDLGLSHISTHAGFLPSSVNDPNRAKLLDRLHHIADHFIKHGLVLLFETGQERIEVLCKFLDELGLTNVGINFDPANMILYDMGNPIQSLAKALPRVMQVHVKDAVRTEKPGQWGTEVPLGQGDVDWRSLVNVLTKGQFQGPLIIERESGDDRIGDICKATTFLAATKG